MFRMSQLVSLILAFVLGFSCAGGILIGGAAIALGTFKARDLERYEIVDIPDELFMGENPKVDLLDLTAFQMIDEFKRLYALGDQVTIKVLEEEYAIKIPSAANKFLTDEAKNLPLKSLFSEKGVKELLSTVYIGYVQSFECHQLDSTEPADPRLGEGNARWYNPTTGQYVTGINETLSFICLGDFVSGKVDIQAVIGGIKIGEALGYYADIDPETGEEIWCDGVTGDRITGIMGVFAGCTVYDVGDRVNTVKIGELLGYVEKDGVWYEQNGETGEFDVKLVGVVSVFAGCTINEVGDKINTARVGELLGYDRQVDPITGDEVWYEQNPETGVYDIQVRGLMGFLAPTPIMDVGSRINEARIGDLLGYEAVIDPITDNEVWYEENEETGEFDVKVTGLMKVLAPSKIDEVGDTINKTALGSLLGYEEIDGVWYEQNEVTGEYDVEVSGIMSVLAPSKIDEVGNTINNSLVGDLLGYKRVGEKWYEKDELTGEYTVEVDGFMTKIANEQMDSIGNAFDSLTIGDMISEEEQDDGIFAILSPDTPITDIASEINSSITNSPLQFFINNELITFDEATQLSLDTVCEDFVEFSEGDDEFEKYYKGHGDWEMQGGKYLVPEWRTQPLGSSFNYIINMLTPPIPIEE